MTKRNCKKAYRKGYQEAQEEIKDLLSDVKDDIKSIEFLVSTASDVSLDNLLTRLMRIRKNITSFEAEEYETSPVYVRDLPERKGRVRTILDFDDGDNNDLDSIVPDIDTIGDEIFDDFNRRR